MSGIVYLLVNEAMPGLTKIGFTTDNVESRITQLNSHSGVPLPFECHFAAEVADFKKVEKILHQLFADHRVNQRREFFKIDPERVVLAISLTQHKDVTPGHVLAEKDDQEALEKVKQRRPKINLELLGIKIGDFLTFSRDESIQAEVYADGRILLDGQLFSLSAGALLILKRMGYRTPTVSGSDYWMFDGELLDERRRRIEAEKFE